MFKNSPKRTIFGIFNELLYTQNVNVARFARSQCWILSFLISFSGDEILALNGKSLQGMSHDEAINEFRAIKQGPVILKVAKRDPNSDQDPIVIVKE